MEFKNFILASELPDYFRPRFTINQNTDHILANDSVMAILDYTLDYFNRFTKPPIHPRQLIYLINNDANRPYKACLNTLIRLEEQVVQLINAPSFRVIEKQYIYIGNIKLPRIFQQFQQVPTLVQQFQPIGDIWYLLQRAVDIHRLWFLMYTFSLDPIKPLALTSWKNNAIYGTHVWGGFNTWRVDWHKSLQHGLATIRSAGSEIDPLFAKYITIPSLPVPSVIGQSPYEESFFQHYYSAAHTLPDRLVRIIETVGVDSEKRNELFYQQYFNPKIPIDEKAVNEASEKYVEKLRQAVESAPVEKSAEAMAEEVHRRSSIKPSWFRRPTKSQAVVLYVPKTKPQFAQEADKNVKRVYGIAQELITPNLFKLGDRVIRIYREMQNPIKFDEPPLKLDPNNPTGAESFYFYRGARDLQAKILNAREDAYIMLTHYLRLYIDGYTKMSEHPYYTIPTSQVAQLSIMNLLVQYIRSFNLVAASTFQLSLWRDPRIAWTVVFGLVTPYRDTETSAIATMRTLYAPSTLLFFELVCRLLPLKFIKIGLSYHDWLIDKGKGRPLEYGATLDEEDPSTVSFEQVRQLLHLNEGDLLPELSWLLAQESNQHVHADIEFLYKLVKRSTDDTPATSNDWLAFVQASKAAKTRGHLDKLNCWLYAKHAPQYLFQEWSYTLLDWYITKYTVAAGDARFGDTYWWPVAKYTLPKNFISALCKFVIIPEQLQAFENKMLMFDDASLDACRLKQLAIAKMATDRLSYLRNTWAIVKPFLPTAGETIKFILTRYAIYKIVNYAVSSAQSYFAESVSPTPLPTTSVVAPEIVAPSTVTETASAFAQRAFEVIKNTATNPQWPSWGFIATIMSLSVIGTAATVAVAVKTFRRRRSSTTPPPLVKTRPSRNTSSRTSNKTAPSRRRRVPIAKHPSRAIKRNKK